MSGRVWQAIAGPLTIVFLIRALNPNEQGVYSVLTSVMGIQLFFELGLLNVLISQAGHLASEIHSNQPESSQRLGNLSRVSQHWFLVASLMYAIVAIAFGWRAIVDKTTTSGWQGPLVFLSLAAAGTVALSPRMAILEGAGFRDAIYRMRLIQMVLGAIVVWGALLAGFKLWALVASATVQFACCAVVSQFQHRDFFSRLTDSSSSMSWQGSGFAWFREVFPLQWRVAVSSIAYHIATQFFSVILIRYQSEADAGKLGMTMTITMAIQGMALTWIQTKFSLVSGLHGTGDREGAGTMWRRSAIISTLLLVGAMIVVTGAISLLPLANRGWENRFIEPWQLLVLAAGCLANHWIALQGFYVLARKGRPFLPACLIGFASTALAVYFGGRFYGISGIVIGYALTMGLVTLPLHSLSYLAYRRQA
jgi:O-antigen/teichoic acid export membrane protein